MRKKYYLPRQYKARLLWLQLFARKVEEYASMFDIDAATVEQTNNDALIAAYIVEVIEIFKHELAERVSFKDSFYDGKGKNPIIIPAMPTVPTLPAGIIVIPGAFKRATKLVQQIKVHANYNEALGKDMAIIGAEKVVNWSTAKPSLKLKLQGRSIVIMYNKGVTEGIRIFSRRGNETKWELLASDSESPYFDNRPNLVDGQAETREYKAYYIMHDELAGQESAVYSISVNLLSK